MLPTSVLVPSLSSIGDWYTIATCSPSSPATTRFEVEANFVEHVPSVDDAIDGLLVGEGMCFTDVVADHRFAHQLVGEVEVALVPDDEVVQLHHFTGGPGHANTSSASVSSNGRHGAFDQPHAEWRDRSGKASQPFSVITGRTIRYTAANR